MVDKNKILFVLAGLTAVTLAVFWQVNSFEFTNYDDNQYVTQNNHISTGLKWSNIIWAVTSEHSGNWHPLTGLSHMLDCQLYDLKPGLHHSVNLLFHIVNTLLLFVVLRQMTGALWQSAFVAALFALHPLHVESVAWISERKDVLSTFFWILTMAAYFNYVKNPAAGRYILTLILFVLGLMSKPMLVTLPFVLLLLDYWPLNRLQTNGAGKIKWQIYYHLIWEKIPFFVLSVVSSIITFVVQKSTGAVTAIEMLSPTVRVANAIVSYVKYITKMVWPTNLAVLYPYPVGKLPFWQVISAALLLLIITICVICFARKYRYLSVGWFWYLMTLLPVIGLVQVGSQAMADRYTYVPLTGLFIIIAWGADDLLTGWKYRRIILSLSSVVIISALSVCTWLQTDYWRNSKNLLERAIKVTMGNYIAYNNLGAALIVQDKFDEAINPLRNAVELRPDFADAFKNLGIAYGKLGRPQEEKEAYKQAIEAYKQTVKSNPNSAAIHVRIGEILSSQGKLDEAADYLHKALKIEPHNPEALCTLGVVLGQQGKFDDAVAQFNEALRIKPDFADAHGNLGYVLLNQDKFDEAVAHLTRAVQLDPNSEKSHYYLAIALGEKGRIDRGSHALRRCRTA